MTPAQLLQITNLLTSINTSIGASVTGSVILYAGAAIPSGYLLCDGAAVSRTTYAGLFAALGTAWGAGNGTTTFNLPDLRGRVPVGVGTGSGLTARALAATGGEESHVQLLAEMAAHAHGATAGAGLLNNAAGTEYVHTLGDTGTVEGATDIQGASAAANVMQPFAALNYAIKT